jgi:hypothetical protein
MKKLLIALLLVSGLANAAEEWFESANNSGGKIVLLTYACPNAPTLKRMYAYHKEGMTFWGCWNYWNDMVHVVYDNGDNYTYDPTLFARKTKP